MKLMKEIKDKLISNNVYLGSIKNKKAIDGLIDVSDNEIKELLLTMIEKIETQSKMIDRLNGMNKRSATHYISNRSR